jgi:hypothetical protein
LFQGGRWVVRKFLLLGAGLGDWGKKKKERREETSTKQDPGSDSPRTAQHRDPKN